jgi:hypothetical protein
MKLVYSPSVSKLLSLANNNNLETWGVDGNVIWSTHVRGVCYLYGGSCRQQIGVKNVLLKY